MARSDRPFEILEKVGDNAYKLQQPRDMAVSATFNIGDLSPYVKDNFEDPSDLRSNPSEEGEVDARALAKEAQGNLGDQQAKDNHDQGAIQALFSFTSSRVCTVLGAPLEGSNQGMIGRVLLCWTP